MSLSNITLVLVKLSLLLYLSNVSLLNILNILLLHYQNFNVYLQVQVNLFNLWILQDKCNLQKLKNHVKIPPIETNILQILVYQFVYRTIHTNIKFLILWILFILDISKSLKFHIITLFFLKYSGNKYFPNPDISGRT